MDEHSNEFIFTEGNDGDLVIINIDFIGHVKMIGFHGANISVVFGVFGDHVSSIFIIKSESAEKDFSFGAFGHKFLVVIGPEFTDAFGIGVVEDFCF